jgi:hypothetical protein
MEMAAVFSILAIIIGVVGLALPLVVLVALYLIYSKLNNIEKLLERRQ